MAELEGAKKRSNRHDIEKFPLETNEEYEQLLHSCSLIEALYKWGGSDAEWAKYVGVVERTVRRWIDDPSRMNVEALDRTCALTGVSPDYLLDGHLSFWGSLQRMPWEPTAAEKDRYDVDTMREAYSRLDEEDQRTVTRLVEKLIAGSVAMRTSEITVDLIDDLVDRAYHGEVTDDEWEQRYHNIFVAEEAQEEQEPSGLENDAIPELKQRITELKEARKAKLRRARKAAETDNEAPKGD